MITMLPPNMRRAYGMPMAKTVCGAPINESISPAYITPIIEIMMVKINASNIACMPDLEASSVFFSPTRRATIAVAAILKPIATE